MAPWATGSWSTAGARARATARRVRRRGAEREAGDRCRHIQRFVAVLLLEAGRPGNLEPVYTYKFRPSLQRLQKLDDALNVGLSPNLHAQCANSLRRRRRWSRPGVLHQNAAAPR